LLLNYIASDRIASNAQLDGALEYLGALGAQPLDVPQFEQAAGVNVEVRATVECLGKVCSLGWATSTPAQDGALRNGAIMR
jgi:hypothetical protein